MLKIGIVLNYKNAEKKKDELIALKKGRDLNNKYTINRNGKKYVPADVGLGLYILENYNNIIIDLIRPNEISMNRFKQNDIVFIIIYDLVEAFHLSSPQEFKKYKRVLKSSDNIYPPYQYQKFINNKVTYYKYLESKNIPVAPTYGITKEKWYSRNPEKYVNNLISKFIKNKWESIIAKPVYGQESIDFAKFMNIRDTNPLKLKNYIGRILPKYKGIVIQEFIKGFDKKNPEFRMYYLNGIYRYCIITVNGDVKCPIQEGGKFKINNTLWNYIMRFSKKIMESLPKFNLPPHLRNSILTRIDIGSGLKSAPHTLFVNEIEFVPSLYIEDQEFPIVEEIAKSLLEVAFEYRFADNLPIKVVF
jgi:hypothetical protein